jgi:hypothetical protein
MNFLVIADEGQFQWFHSLLQPEILPFVIAIIAVVGGISIAILKAVMHHRERMAKIEHGIDPDAKVDSK